jgi:PAS domain S-box-containing protein
MASRDDDSTGARASAELQVVLLGEAALHGPVAVFVADEFMRYVAANDAACVLLGYTRDELLGLHVTDVASAPVAPELYAEMLRRGSSVGVTPVRRKDGTVVQLTYCAGKTQIAGMPFYVSFGWVADDSPSV